MLFRISSDNILIAMGFQTKHKVAHAFTSGKLPENHAHHLIPTGKRPYLFIAGVLCSQAVKNSTGKKICKLSEDIFALIHCFTFNQSKNKENSIQIVTLGKDS